jgi:hypothetical protein
VRRLLSVFALILAVGSTHLWSLGRYGLAFLFLLTAAAVLSRSSYLAFRDRPYRRSLSLALVLPSISGLFTLIALRTPRPIPTKRIAALRKLHFTTASYRPIETLSAATTARTRSGLGLPHAQVSQHPRAEHCHDLVRQHLP